MTSVFIFTQFQYLVRLESHPMIPKTVVSFNFEENNKIEDNFRAIMGDYKTKESHF